jgi:hypothetical protein
MLGSRLYVVYSERLMSGDPEQPITPGTQRPHDAAADDATMTGSEAPKLQFFGYLRTINHRGQGVDALTS